MDYDYVLTLFQAGTLCDCRLKPIWDRVYDDSNKFIGYELSHNHDCIGRIKAAELVKELKNELGG